MTDIFPVGLAPLALPDLLEGVLIQIAIVETAIQKIGRTAIYVSVCLDVGPQVRRRQTFSVRDLLDRSVHGLPSYDEIAGFLDRNRPRVVVFVLPIDREAMLAKRLDHHVIYAEVFAQAV